MSAAPSLLKDEARRKRLGQYFTGDRLARLLVAICRPRRLRSVVDPMCGSGDMLAAVRQAAPGADLAGIDIDHDAIEACTTRLDRGDGTGLQLIEGNAFTWDAVSQLPRLKSDLVITNPPYVRYQSLAGTTGEEGIPSGEEVRQGLLEIAQNMDDLDEGDRQIFLSLIENYSGLSDLAVPSWLL
jgi:tRNA G10  N-methylase Trm11